MARLRPHRPILLVLLVPLLLAAPAVPAHDKGDAGQWDVACFDPAPSTPDLRAVHTRTLGYTPGELALSEDRLIVSRWGSGGLEVYSLADPLAPALLDAIWTPGTTMDVKASADGDTIFAGSSGRIHIIDARDPRDLRHVRSVTLPVPNVDQGHMLHDTVIDGREYLLAATQSGNGVYIYEVTGSAANRNLAFTARFAPGSPLGAHDMYVQHDPVDGRPLLFVANGFAGWIAADLSDPALPVPLAVVPNPDLGQSYVHTIQAEWVDGRRIVATIAELGANILRVWDATIPSAPLLLGEWSSQSPAGFVPSATSQHNIQIVDGRLYMAHYRCGFYVFDLADLPMLPVPTALAPASHFAPVDANGQHWDVVLRNGHIYTSDMRLQNGGAFHVVAYDALTPGDVDQTSTG